MSPTLSRLGLLLLLIVSASIGLGAACNGTRRPPVAPDLPASSAEPTLRIYYLVDLDGYLEPCGCQSRPLGGIDRLAQFIQSEQAHASNALFVATGDLLYRDPTLDPRMTFQESAKADAMIRILDQLHLTAFAPGPSDFVRGAEAWRQTVQLGHAAALAANVDGALRPAFQGAIVREVQGVRVGIVGVSDFHETPDATPPDGSPGTTDPVAAARAAVASVRQQGARVVVVLASVPRRVARTIAGDVPGVNFVIAAREEANLAPPPERIGNAYLVTATNQGKSVGILDVYLRGSDAGLVDASSATATATRDRLDTRIHDLRGRIAQWEREQGADPAAIAQQRTRLTQMEADRARLDAPTAPPTGSYFRARVQEISPDLTKRHDVETTIAAYFHAVNEHNRIEYASLRTPSPAPGQAGYLGNESCRDCHAPAFDIWERTLHSHAYHTLEVVDKQFNLSCVSCHVTGYRQPGGAEVVQNEGLRDVQCESCHGPGSLHVAARTAALRRSTIRREVPGSFCASECHTPEHSDHFDYASYLPRILGPGHGYPVGSTQGGISLSMPIQVGGATPTPGNTPPSDAGVAHDP